MPLPSDTPDHPALRTGLLTYLGNKRKLLPLIWQGMRVVAANGTSIRTCADPFTGTGVVARMFRLAGLAVTAADLEEYARPGGRAFLEISRSDIPRVLPQGLEAALHELNRLDEPREASSRYFLRHYAPRSTAAADPDRERLFYTTENASRIDAMLEHIHAMRDEAGRDLLLAHLLPKMSIHINTSGVMKGFHHGWGGRGKDALRRIMSPIELQPLPLIDGPRGSMLTCAATDLPPGPGGLYDVCYLDPPYTVHQYGANYHLLTSAVRNDHWDPGPVRTGARAGIRPDHNRSPFCSRSPGVAGDALEAVVSRVGARNVLLSYNEDGIIPLEEILTLLSDSRASRVEILWQAYSAFRGGKANQAGIRTRELLFISQRGVPQSRRDVDRIRDELAYRREERSVTQHYLLPATWRRTGGNIDVEDDQFRLTYGSAAVAQVDRALRFTSIQDRTMLSRLERASGDLIHALEEAVECGYTETALALLQRLKIRKYVRERTRIATAVNAMHMGPSQRSRFRKICRRIGAELP